MRISARDSLTARKMTSPQKQATALTSYEAPHPNSRLLDLVFQKPLHGVTALHTVGGISTLKASQHMIFDSMAVS